MRQDFNCPRYACVFYKRGFRAVFTAVFLGKLACRTGARRGGAAVSGRSVPTILLLNPRVVTAQYTHR